MEGVAADWLNLVLRWAHVITATAWVGSSFFFMWLDAHIEPPEDGDEGIEGNLWMVHGGGFYNMVKFDLAPGQLPKTLHWVKWEAGFAWITGILLFILIYYFGASVYTMPAQPTGLGLGGTIAVSVAALAAAWLLYDAYWNSAFAARAPAVGAAVCFVLLLAIAWGFAQVMSDRAAYLHVGALLGTVMAANVWIRIIPSQQELVAATREGRRPDAKPAIRAKTRSVHNNYMTLPVVFIMLSTHYAGTYGAEWGWAILGLIALSGAAIRHVFNLRNAGKMGRSYLFAAAGSAGMLVLLGIWLAGSAAPDGGSGEKVAFAEARQVIATRCAVCHSAKPTLEGFEIAPKGVEFDTAQQIRLRARDIARQAVQSDTMPPGNMTDMTEDERKLLGRWIAQGANTD